MKKVWSATRVQGISDFIEEGQPDTVAFCRSIDYRTDPNQITLLPKTTKESGSVVIDLPKWGEIIPSTAYLYYYGDGGSIYQRTPAGSHTFLRTVASSHGNGLGFYQEDDFLYYTSDSLVGRYGPISSATPTFVDDFFGSQGGVPQNTNSIDFEASSSQYASRADTASLSITGNIAMDIQIKPESLPAVGSSMVLMSKWDESGSTRSYKFDIAGVSGYFGDGSDGALTVSVNTTQAPIDSACSGTSGATTLSATNASFATGQVILIHQTRGTGAGTWMRNSITGYTAGTITLQSPLNADYVSSGSSAAQVIVLKQYTNVTVNSGITWTAKAWDGTVGGILAFIASGTLTINGTITASGKGFRGGAAVVPSKTQGYAGEGTAGASSQTTSANGNGGGGGAAELVTENSSGAGGAGGGNASSGSNGSSVGAVQGGTAGSSSGTTDLTTLTFGGGGGSGGTDNSDTGPSGAGGNGGGIIFAIATTTTMGGAGSLISSGVAGGSPGLNYIGAGGGGAGGSVLLKFQTGSLGTNQITVAGGAGGTTNPAGNGGAGSTGRIHADYYTSITGTSSPAINSTQDNTLVTNTTYQLRLSVSSTGANSETLAQVFTPQVGVWQQVGVSWVASTSTATFFLNAVSLGTRVGTLTAIHDNASTFQLAMSKNGAAAASNFYDGLMDEARLFNMTRSEEQMMSGLQNQIATNTAGLAAYYKLNGNFNDATANANNLTGTNSPTFVTDVPYPSPTTRLDIDQFADESGDTYAVPTAISEAAADRLTFTPEKDPQKSIQFNVSNIGTGTWTVTIHDQFNNVIATSTVTTANMHTGDYEFTYASQWRPLINVPYHAHLTCASGSPTVVTDVNNDLETADFVTYYGFLVNDTAWHPIGKMLNFIVFGNDRYIAKWDAQTYNSNRVTLPAGWSIRCFAYWHEFLAVGTVKGGSLTDFDQGRIFFWDGISDTYNFYIDVPEGGINAMLGSRGNLYVFAGYQGDLLVYQGGDSAVKVKRVPKVTIDTTTGMYPGAMTMWKTLLHFGVAGEGNSTVVEKGVYSWGSNNKNYVDSLSYDYPISTGVRTGTTLKVGMVVPVQNKLLIGWQDNVAYGVDVVDPAGNPFASGTVEFLIQKEDFIWRDQIANKLRQDILPISTGESVSIKMKLNRETNWQTLATADSDTIFDDSTTPTIESDIYTGRNREYQLAYDLFATGSTSPTSLGLSLYLDALEGEQQF